jgi:hypothetical protein
MTTASKEDAREMAEKCSLCHLFVERNFAHIEGDGLAEYVHRHRGDDADDALDMSHEPRPSGMIATLRTWRTYGPDLMRERFVILDPYGTEQKGKAA